MRYGLWLLLLLWVPLLATADIYQWTDNKGVVHFTDMPLPGATSVNLADDSAPADVNPTSANISANPGPAVADASNKSDAGSTTEATKSEQSSDYYKKLAIVQPLDKASYFNGSGRVDLIIEVKPKIRSDDKAVVLIDGKAFPTSQSDTLLRVENVDRGTHAAQVQIQDKSGHALISSNSITFYMHRGTVSQQSANAPAMKIKTNP
jgi:hypothetical protein